MAKATSQLPKLASTADRLEALLKGAQAGDQDARDEARALMDAEPDVWRHFADLPRQVELSLLDSTYRSTWSLSAVALQRRLAEMRAELGQDRASPLERLAIDRVCTTWLAVHLAEIIAAQSTGGSFPQLDFYQRRVTQAQRRHLAAIRTLATLRRLLAPALPKVSIGQMNVADRQINAAHVASANGASSKLGQEP